MRLVYKYIDVVMEMAGIIFCIYASLEFNMAYTAVLIAT